MFSYLYPEKNLQKFEKDNNYCQGCPVGKWGKMKKCKHGSFAIGAEIGLHDDYGLSNLKIGDPNQCVVNDRFGSYQKWSQKKFLTYRASVINLRLYCSEYQLNDQGESTTRLQGDLNDDFENDPWMRAWKKPPNCQKCWPEHSEQYVVSYVHKNQM